MTLDAAEAAVPPLPPTDELVKPRFKIRFPAPVEERMSAFDRAVDEAVFDHLRGRPWADRLFYAASALGDHGLIWLLLGAVRGLRSEHDWHAAVRLGIGIGVESLLVNVGIKSLFRRQRPVFDGARPFHLRTPLTSSFPSGHATSAFTAAALLGDRDKLKPVYYAVAVVVALSRIHVRIHHASDVAAGALVGVALGAAGRRLFPLPYPPDPES